MLNAIAMWSGTLASIPANWNLCDGSGGTPNLIARFLRGVPAATEPGTTGGADSHTHASMTSAGAHTHTLDSKSHTHNTNTVGDHAHGGAASGSDTGLDYWGYRYTPKVGDHSHTTQSISHSHTLESAGSHSHTINTADGRPPFYEVAYIQAGAGAAIVNGIIIIWSGTIVAIPAGWELCDGGDTRPDLREKFVRCVNTNITNPGAVGGGIQHTHILNNCATHGHNCTTDGSHSGHTFSLYTWTHAHPEYQYKAYYSTPRTFYDITDSGAGNHTHTTSGSTGTPHNHNTIGQGGAHLHTVQNTSSLPQYRDVAYIYCNGAVIVPTGGILVWAGLLANIPGGYNLCDGGGGRPDYRERFIRGAANGVDPGGAGGSDAAHTHVDNIGGSHNNHTQQSAGVHSHDNTNTVGGHAHSYTTHEGEVGPSTMLSTEMEVQGAHSHTISSNGTAHSHIVGAVSAQHDHQPWSSDEGRPAFYEVAFIINVTPPVVAPTVTTQAANGIGFD